MLRQDKTKKRQIALNIQTTGYEAERDDHIIQIAALEYIDGQYTGNSFSTLINPEGKIIDQNITECNGIENKDVVDAPTFADIADQFFDFIKEDDIVLQNAIYTVRFINYAMLDRQEKAEKMLVELNTQIAKIESEILKLSNKLSIVREEINEKKIEKPEKKLMAKLQKELDLVQMSYNNFNRIAKTEWLDFCVDRNVHDVMALDQKLYPRRDGYSHKLNAICERLAINQPIAHTAENRAKLAMDAYLHLCAEEVRRKNVLDQQKHTIFANKRRDDAIAQRMDQSKQPTMRH